MEGEPDALRARVESTEVCVGARSWSAGTLGKTVLYRIAEAGQRVSVGYFVYWSEERPWGANAMSYTVLPALATDAVYSHFLYVFPGMKDAIYGPADIEGVRVDFERDPSGALRVVGGRAQDATHGDVDLTAADLVDDRGRIILLTDAWSHQLGAHGGGAFANGGEGELRCYQAGALRPMTDDVATAYRLGSERAPQRAKPAWSAPPAGTVQTAISTVPPTRVE